MKSMLNLLYKVKGNCRATNQLVFILITIILLDSLGREVNLGHNYDGDFISLKCLVHSVP